MAKIKQVELFAVDLPFRRPFEHAAARRETSDSIFLKCTLDSGICGFGESLPREYVTGQTRDDAFSMLRDQILPRLVNREFQSLDAVRLFLSDCDGKAPAGWVDPRMPQTAAWCAVDLALLDAFGRQFDTPLTSAAGRANLKTVRYSGVLSSGKKLRSLLKIRLYGFNRIKIKVEENTSMAAIKRLGAVLGRRCDLRVDANMAWEKDQALALIKALSRYGIGCVEQPLPVEQIDTAAELVRESDCLIMADEGFSDRDSLQQLIEKQACSAINARLAKCGGVIATQKRCREAMDAGLAFQIGCQVGESSLLSAAQLLLASQLPEARYLEGCFGLLLLKEDPVKPLLQFGRGGRSPAFPAGPGLAVTVDETILKRWTGEVARIS